MPDVLLDFMKTYKRAVSYGSIEKIVYKSVKTDPRYSQKMCDIILCNYDRLNSIVAECAQSEDFER